MKSQVILALLSSTQALDTLSGMAFSSSTNCGQCIRNGWYYCTTSPYSTGTKPASDMCCDPSATLDNTSCATGYSGTNTRAGGSTCTPDFSSKDKALLSCPFVTATCGSTNAFVFANKVAVNQRATATGLDMKGSCTWVVKATCDSPGFEVVTITNAENYLIHWYEYSSTTPKDSTVSTFPK